MTGVLLLELRRASSAKTGSDADFGEAGELSLRGPNVAIGYPNDKKSDLGTFTADGRSEDRR